jgi:hypothetical protein
MRKLHVGYGDRRVPAENEAYNQRMESGDYTYIWQADDWPRWRYDLAALAAPLTEARGA